VNTTELIYKKAKTLDEIGLQELNDFLDFLLLKKSKSKAKEELFPVTELETPQSNSPYTGKALTIEEMDDAINYEAGQHK